MQEYLTFAASAPLVTMLVAIARQLVPAIDGVWVPRLVVALVIAWGGVLTFSGDFTGSPAEFIIAAAAVSAGSIGIDRLAKVTDLQRENRLE